MADESDIDVSIASLWQSWQAFVCGKRASPVILNFRANLERNLLQLTKDIQTGTYQHNGYNSFIVHDPKRREIAVANVRDRVVHRLLYDYLVPIWDKSFCYDAWSCRKGKGLHGAIQRAQTHMRHYSNGWLWRSDITKFFDNVDHDKLKYILRTKTRGKRALNLLDNVIHSYDNSQSVSQSVLMVCQSVT